MTDIKGHKNNISYRQLLETRLNSLGVLVAHDDPRFQYLVEYDMKAVERGIKIVDAVNALKNIGGAMILDIGCGTGGQALAFAQKNATVIGLDPDVSICELATIRSKEMGESIDILISDGTMNPFPDSSFDVIICNDVFEHVKQKKKLAHEISRLLKIDGVVYINTPNKLSPWNILWDDHTGLPFITLLPRKVQDLYVKAAGLSKRGLPYTLKPPTYSSLIKGFSGTDIDLGDQIMQLEISKTMFFLDTDILSTSRSNLYPHLTSMLIKLLRLTYEVFNQIGLPKIWWLGAKMIYPKLIFIGKKTRMAGNISNYLN